MTDEKHRWQQAMVVVRTIVAITMLLFFAAMFWAPDAAFFVLSIGLYAAPLFGMCTWYDAGRDQ